jgi:hypothetical protein
MENEKTTKNSCTFCNYHTKNNSDYTKHLLTKKHLKNVSNTTIPTKKYKCENCSKEYSYRQSLYFHRNKCNVVKEKEMNKILNVVTTQHTLVETFVENQQTFVENHQTIVEKQTSLIENQSSLINELTMKINELEKKQSIVNNITNNNNIKFDINVYLNETCSNALNFEDTIPKIFDLEMFKNFDGNKTHNKEQLNKYFHNLWKNIPQIERPIQTKSVKNKNWWIKCKDQWEKGSEQYMDFENPYSPIRGVYISVNRANCHYNNNSDNYSESFNDRIMKCGMNLTNVDEIFMSILPSLLQQNKIEQKYIDDEK